MKINRRNFLKFAGASFTGVLAGSLAEARPRDERKSALVLSPFLVGDFGAYSNIESAFENACKYFNPRDLDVHSGKFQYYQEDIFLGEIDERLQIENYNCAISTSLHPLQFYEGSELFCSADAYFDNGFVERLCLKKDRNRLVFSPLSDMGKVFSPGSDEVQTKDFWGNYLNAVANYLRR